MSAMSNLELEDETGDFIIREAQEIVNNINDDREEEYGD